MPSGIIVEICYLKIIAAAHEHDVNIRQCQNVDDQHEPHARTSGVVSAFLVRTMRRGFKVSQWPSLSEKKSTTWNLWADCALGR